MLIKICFILASGTKTRRQYHLNLFGGFVFLGVSFFQITNLKQSSSDYKLLWSFFSIKKQLIREAVTLICSKFGFCFSITIVL